MWPTSKLFTAGPMAALLLAGAMFLGSPALESLAPGQEGGDSRAKTERLARLVNFERVQAGRLPLARSTELDAAAEQHSRDMATRDFLEHEGSDGSTPRERAERAGYRVPSGSGWLVEVISAISDQPDGPLNWWLHESPQIHGKHLRDPRYREMGIGYASGGTYGNYWTVLLACRPGVLPVVEFEGITHRHDEQCDQNQVAQAEPPVGPAPTAQTERSSDGASGQAPMRGGATLRADETTTRGGRSVIVSWDGVPDPSPRDWIGMYSRGSSDRDYRVWTYVGCRRAVSDISPSRSCSLWIPEQIEPGDYELRLFANDAYSVLASTGTLTVRPPAE